ncbi:MAG TPA: hypothetical protein VMW48_18470, partial [Vicinamibacterales bacterium]|nr:hypothetical protein [Vicinamibacterales bacterium]
MFSGDSARASRGASWMLVLVVAAAFLTPLSLRAVNRAVTGAVPGLGYLPALELRRPHRAFNAQPIADLQYGKPAWVFIGDSMMGTRIEPVHLGEISSTHDQLVAFLN